MKILPDKLSSALIFTLQLVTITSLLAQYKLDDVNINTHKRHYNSLPSVEENDVLLKSAPQFNSFLKEAEEIVTRYELESSVGLRLIHRHFSLEKSQVMAEEYALVEQIPSLVTQAHQIEDAHQKGAIPASWILSDNSQEEAVLFEASNDSAVKLGSYQLQKSPEFFDEMRKLFTENQLHHLLAVALLKRDFLIAEKDQAYMEVNSGHEHKSVVQLWNSNKKPKNAIRTSWSFKGPQQGMCHPHWLCVPLQNGHEIVKGNGHDWW